MSKQIMTIIYIATDHNDFPNNYQEWSKIVTGIQVKEVQMRLSWITEVQHPIRMVYKNISRSSVQVQDDLVTIDLSLMTGHYKRSRSSDPARPG